MEGYGIVYTDNTCTKLVHHKPCFQILKKKRRNKASDTYVGVVLNSRTYGFRGDVRPLKVPRSTACPEPSRSTPRGVHLFSEGYVAPLSFSFYIYFLETAHCPSLRTNRLSFQNSSEIGFPRICSFYKPVTNFKRTVAADKKKLARAIYENERYRNLESSAQSEKKDAFI